MAAWWERPGLEIRDGRLTIAGRDAETLGRTNGTPVFAYDLLRIEEQARSLEGAFERRGVPFRLRLALKAQREPEVLAFVRGLGSVGLDVCSPGEARHGLEHGWAAREMSFTGTNLSERDLDALLEIGLHVNLDLLSQLDRWGRRAPGSSVGIRVNPRAGAAWAGAAEARRGAAREPGESLYAGTRATKFGILPEQLDDAVEIAAKHELAIDTLHFHVGDGFLTDGLAHFEVAVERVAEMSRRLAEAGHRLAEVNAGGGLGVPQAPGERPLDVDAYADVLVAPPRRPGRDDRVRAGGLPVQGLRRAPRRGRHARRPGRGDLRRARRRLQRGPRALHLRLRRARSCSAARRTPSPYAPTPCPGTSTRATTSGARRWRCPSSARATWWPSSPSGATTGRCISTTACGRRPAGRVRGSDLTSGPQERSGASRRSLPALPR